MTEHGDDRIRGALVMLAATTPVIVCFGSYLTELQHRGQLRRGLAVAGTTGREREKPVGSVPGASLTALNSL